jgi:hypothetical protein
VRAGLSLNQAAKTETSQVVGHLRGGIWASEERRDAWPQIAMAKSRDDTKLNPRYFPSDRFVTRI